MQIKMWLGKSLCCGLTSISIGNVYGHRVILPDSRETLFFHSRDEVAFLNVAR